MKKTTLTTETAATSETANTGKGRWVALFDGETLDGWTRHGGQMEYEVVDGAIVGTVVRRQHNGFLCTDKEYGDFILEYEFKVDSAMNSGVQIRSHYETDDRGREFVYGYQIEIDPSDRAWSAGIYEERGREWLVPVRGDAASEKSFVEKTKGAFKQNEWNKVRVEAIGGSLKTWLNDVAAADLKDDKTPKGIIGLQVHQGRPGLQVMWRNLRIQEIE
ncbi:DUF1080 domain-containing protein [Candidatus Sumerlaeota bacterium]|nr:DUF1080 domain-containing protein [Candidatus Sumerlaeota bacterium]